jgi:hypothetical protein
MSELQKDKELLEAQIGNLIIEFHQRYIDHKIIEVNVRYHSLMTGGEVIAGIETIVQVRKPSYHFNKALL